MKLCQTVLHLGIGQAALATSLTNSYVRNARDSCIIKWEKCDIPAILPVECGTLAVPLDYTDPDSEKTLNLSLVKVPAQKTPSKGSILFNFGGPGYEAILTLAAQGERLQM